ncbi:MAG: hypothetical protein ABIR79_14345 [Candidatus Binatia bacterium]
MRYLRLLATSALALVALSGIADAACGPRYVATTGSDPANACLAAGTPCATIQHAVDQACAGDAVNVAAGTYPEQIAITKNGLTITGAAGVTIRPSVVVTDASQGDLCTAGSVGTAIVLVSGATGVTLNNLTVNGSLAGTLNGPSGFVGIYFRNASGAINGGAVLDIRHNPFDGVQDGLAIFVQANAPNTSAVDTTGVTVSGYQKNGITYNGCGCALAPNGTVTGTISGNTITGTGPTAVIAQNGIQIGRGAGPVTVADNSSGNNFYTGASGDTAAGILLFSTRNDLVTGNVVTANNQGLAIQGGVVVSPPSCSVAGDSIGNTITCNRFSANGVGISTDALMTAAHSNTIKGNGVGADGSAIAAGSLDATSNWWGCSAGPGNPGCDSVTANVDASSPLAAPAACVPCGADADCSDANVCNGIETCNLGTSICAAGTPLSCGACQTCDPIAGCAGAICTPTPTPTVTPTPSPSATPTVTPIPTVTLTSTPTRTITPTPTLTATPTPTATATPSLPPVNHFQCYETHHSPTRIVGLPLDDQFGPGIVEVKKAKRICAPADKNDEDPTAPDDADHLTVYTIKQTSPRFIRRKAQVVVNQFGTQTMDVVKPDRMLVPTVKSLNGTPVLPPAFGVDHFKCYRVAYAKLRAFGLKIHDQFGTITIDIKKPTHLCVPADKNGEGIPDFTQYLMCYRMRIAPRFPPAQLPATIFTRNQFGADSYRVFGPRELCVPSQLNP